MIDREHLGRRVHQIWVDWARGQSNPPQHGFAPWDVLPEDVKEANRLIGETIATEILLRVVGDLEARAYYDSAKVESPGRFICRECDSNLRAFSHAPYCLVGHMLSIFDEIATVSGPAILSSEKILPEDEAAASVYAAIRTSLPAQAIMMQWWTDQAWTMANPMVQQAMRDIAEPAYALGLRDTAAASKDGSEMIILELQNKVAALTGQLETARAGLAYWRATVRS